MIEEGPAISPAVATVSRGRAVAGSGASGMGVAAMWALDHYFAGQAASREAALKLAQDGANSDITAGLMELLRACQAH